MLKAVMMPGFQALRQECPAPRHCKCFQPEWGNKWSSLKEGLCKCESNTKLISVKSVLTICQTCMMLSSDTEQITQGSLGFQEKSEIFAVCPPWINCRRCRHTSEFEACRKNVQFHKQPVLWTYQQFRRSIFSILSRLFLSNFTASTSKHIKLKIVMTSCYT